MTQDEIIRMAREAGPLTQGPFDAWCKRFAALVAAAEREACAKWLDFYDGPNGRRAEAIRARGNT